ncbi:MAG: hypothetical protein J07HB67_00849 [halophilic archaeon J07HB67]|jgi:hypothetical protein|nr:MAG: hypothetical protein J07HB67_00849 [halophilic archaeon J07HB67]
MTETTGAGSEGDYGGLLGAFPYALRRSESWLFRSYTVCAAVVAVFLAVVFTLALVQQLGTSEGARFSIARAFVILVGLAAVAPTVTPVLLVARSHRRGADRRRGYEVGLAAAGYLFVVSLYGLVVASAPEQFQQTPEGPFAPLVTALYALPSTYALGIPVAGAAVIVATHYTRR